jgi:hypothetical protein
VSFASAASGRGVSFTVQTVCALFPSLFALFSFFASFAMLYASSKEGGKVLSKPNPTIRTATLTLKRPTLTLNGKIQSKSLFFEYEHR